MKSMLTKYVCGAHYKDSCSYRIAPTLSTLTISSGSKKLFRSITFTHQFLEHFELWNSATRAQNGPANNAGQIMSKQVIATTQPTKRVQRSKTTCGHLRILFFTSGKIM